jgi:hypothetical protein
MRDIDIRRALRVEMRAAHENDPNTLILEEMGLCQGLARVDVAVINGTVHGYEIKSEFDTLARLPGQTHTYNRVFDFVTIVTAKNHEAKISTSVPKWWGISIAVQSKGGVEIRVRRRARRNNAVDPFSIAQLLWREEALEALDRLGLADGIRSKRRDALWLRLAESVPLADLSEIVRKAVKGRPRVARESPQQL